MSRFTKIAACILIALALLLGIVAFRLARQPTLPQAGPVATQNAPKPAPMYDVVVAAKAIAAGQILATTDLTVAKWPVKVVGGYGAVTGLDGKRARVDVAVGEPLLPSMLARGLALSLNPGERAVAISVNRVIGVQNRVEPGDYVDVFFALRKSVEIGGSQVRLLQSHVRVLAYGDNSLDGPPPGVEQVSSQAANRNGVRPAPPTDAVLAVPVSDVDALMLASREGGLQLALRSPNDDGEPDPNLFVAPTPVLSARADLTPQQRDEIKEPVNQAYAGASLTQLSGPVPPAPPKSTPVAQRAPGASVEMIRGDRVSRERY